MSLSSMYQLENLVLGLLEALNDKNTDVQESVIESLVTLGHTKSEFILKQALSFMRNSQSKLTDNHKSLIFNAAEKVVKENLSTLSKEQALDWTGIAANEMTVTKENRPIYLQESASHLLVAIGHRYVDEVFSQLQKLFSPGKLPHLYVVNTMADLAEANPFGVVPNLTDVLTAMLPMIGMAKTEQYKCAFGTAMCKFSEAILYYCSNKEKATDQSVEKSAFATQIYATHDIFFNVWIKSSEHKVRQLAIESIGYFVTIMAREKLENDLVKIVNMLVGLYKKHSDHFVVSQSFYMTIKAAITADPSMPVLDSIVDLAVKELFNQVISSLELQSVKNNTALAVSANNKNQIELLRCFAELTTLYSDKIVPFLIQKFEQNNEKNRIASLTVLKHLINSCKEQMTNKHQLVVSGMRQLLSETNNKVKKSLIQTIIAMAYHGYLNLEGGQLLIEFLLKQCALTDDPEASRKSPDTSQPSNTELRTTSESVLTLFATTVSNMHSILWPNLFEFFTNPRFSSCMAHLCKNLAHIADLKRSTDCDDYLINFESFVNLPKPCELFSRLIILCGVPLANKSQGQSILALMKNFSPNLSSSIVDVWDNVIPKLIVNLEDKIANNKFNQKTWEDLTMKLLSSSLDQINDEQFICEIARSIGKQIETLHMGQPDEKYFAYKCLGLVLNKTTSKATIDKQLETIFSTVDHNSQREREGAAISFGYCASVHLDTVLLKLETLSKSEGKKSGGLFGILKQGGDSDFARATIVLSYGHVTFYAAKDLIVSRLETYILRNVGGYASGIIKELVLKQNVLKAIDLVTKCMHTAHLQKEFNFSYKATLLNQILTFVSADSSKTLTNDTKSMCYQILANIVKLTPKLTEADMFLIVKTSTDSFYSLQLPLDGSHKKNSKKEPFSSTSTSSVAESDPSDPLAAHISELTLLHGDSIYEATSRSLENLLNTCLDVEMTSGNLNFIFKYLEPWLTSLNDHERLRSVRNLSSVLRYFADNYKAIPDQTLNQNDFGYFGHILGSIIGRITDPVITVRLLTIDCIENLLKLYQIFTETIVFEQSGKLFEQLLVFKQKLIKSDANILLGVVSDMTKILCKLIPPGKQLIEFVEKLIEGLLDVNSHCSSSVCIFLNYSVKLRAAELKENVESLMTHLYTKLGLIQNPQAKLGTLRTIRVLFQQHLIESFNVLLTFPIPCTKTGEYLSPRSIRLYHEMVDSRSTVYLDYNFYNSIDMIEICQSLCEDPKLIQSLIDHLLQVWNRCLPYEEKTGTKYASLTPLIGTCILSQIFSNNTTPATEQVFKDNFDRVFCALFLRISSTLANVMPYPRSKDDYATDVTGKNKEKEKKQAIQQEYKKLIPSELSVECLKNFVKSCQSFDLFEYYNSQGVWTLLSSETTNAEGCFLVAKGFCLHQPDSIPPIITNLNLSLSSPYDCHKISVTAFFAELINHECILPLVDKLLNNLLSKLIDQHIPVRTLCIRGLGNVASLGKSVVQSHSTTILSAMMAGLDDKDDLNDDITLESMNGLAKIIALIDESNVRPILINILLRIRPCFEKDKPAIRTSAYRLFGELARFGEGPSREPYMEQIHSNFVSFILHLSEEFEDVRMSCRLVLKKVGPLVESSKVNELFQESLAEGKYLHYGEFVNDLSKLLVNEFPEKISFYVMNSVSNFKSQWTEIRCNAVLFAGYMLGHLSRDSQSVLSKEHITNALIKLLKEDPSHLVRQKAAEAISLLSEF